MVGSLSRKWLSTGNVAKTSIRCGKELLYDLMKIIQMNSKRHLKKILSPQRWNLQRKKDKYLLQPPKDSLIKQYVNPLTIRTAIWRFGLITNCGIDQTMSLNFHYASYCLIRLSWQVHAPMGLATGMSGTFVDYCALVT